MVEISASQLKDCMPAATEKLVQDYAPALSRAMTEFRINTPMRMAAFIAQLAHESSQLSGIIESTYYSDASRLKKLFPSKFKSELDAGPYVKDPIRCANRIYSGKNGNGNEKSGDGWKYRGRGLIQLTGKANYEECGKALGVDLVTNPDELLKPEMASRSAAWFWNTRGCNDLADVGMFGAITQRINGGYNGSEERLAFYARSKKALISQ